MKSVVQSMKKRGGRGSARFLALSAGLVCSSALLAADALGAVDPPADPPAINAPVVDGGRANPTGSSLVGSPGEGSQTGLVSGVSAGGANTASSRGENVGSGNSPGSMPGNGAGAVNAAGSSPAGSIAPLPEIKATAADMTKRTDALLSEAEEAYQGGDYARAAALYQVALEHGARNGHLYYNLGNAYERLGQIGPAILNYRRAQLYLPRDGDVEANLAYARARARDRIEPGEESWARRVFFWYDSVSDFELFWATAVLNLAFWGLLMARGSRPRPGLRWALLVSGLGVLLSGGSAVARAWQHLQSPDAVVLGEEVSVRSGTDVNSVRLFALHAGAEVSTRDRSGDWVRIELPDGKRGWVERPFIGLITP